MKSSDFIYLYIFVVFFIIVLVLFSLSINFIVLNVNQIFSPQTSENTAALNTENYSLVVKKLGLPNNTPENITNSETAESPASQIHNEPDVTTQNVTENTPPPAPIELDKKIITLSIMNTTNKKGVAATLAKVFESAGFSTGTTGNEKGPYSTTTIFIKDSKKEYIPVVEEVVKNSYPKAITKTNPVDSKFDVIIMIGEDI